jgi:formylmethanofuran dehydrogenase subunit D
MITVTLISGRTANQGIGLEEGKLSKRYVESVNHVQLNPEDAEKMSLQAGDRVKVSTDYGSITVNWVPEKGLDSCYVFFPYGPWANQVYASSTSSTGMPIMKGISATIEPSEEKVLSLDEIVEKLKGGA